MAQAIPSGIPRPEHPRPLFFRTDWLCLNGEWSFGFDFGNAGFDRTIRVPFAPESALSGIGHTDFIETCEYQRSFTVPSSWKGRRTLLHFGGVDYECDVFIDGKAAGGHSGGSTPFTLDISSLVTPVHEHVLTVRVRDNTRSGLQPLGKQSPFPASQGCVYTRTTGIWQTVWLEAVSGYGLADCQVLPDLDNGRFVFVPCFRAVKQGLVFRVRVLDGEKIAAEASAPAADGIPVTVSLGNPRTWSPESPFLYQIRYEVVENGTVVDTVTSHAGLRKVHIEGNRLFLNNAPVYLRLVLDQGFYPDGVWTAPTDGALKRDIELAVRAGFNGARLHQKIFDERFHYWADRLGYLTWAEFPDWGMDAENPAAIRNLLCEWKENVLHLRNHPSIIAWTPLNESPPGKKKPGAEHCRLQREVFGLTKALDPTRPVNTVSGYMHGGPADIWTIHHYEQDPGKLDALLSLSEKGAFINYPEAETAYSGQPYVVDEFGGIGWIQENRRFSESSWGYGKYPATLDEFYKRLEGQVRAITGKGHITGFCYTQLTDVEQEQNGIYTYDRREKLDMARIRAIFQMDRRLPA